MRPSLYLPLFLLLSACATRTPTPSPTRTPTPSQPPSQVRVAAIQCSSRFGEVEHNRAKLTRLVEEAASRGAKIIVLPETSITGYVSQDLKRNWHLDGRPIEPAFQGVDPSNAAETMPGPSTKHFAALADRLDVYVTVPFLETTDDEPPRYFNTVCLASPDGKIVAHYRKLTPWPYPEKSWATPGDRGVQIYDTEYGRVGLAICYDIHTILPKYEPLGIWALLYPIAWVDERHPTMWFRVHLPRHVKPFGCYVIGANWSVDEEQSWAGYGYSTILSNDGVILAQAETRTGSEIVYAVLPTAAADAAVAMGK